MTDYFLKGINDVSEERLRQITEEGFNSERDDTYLPGTLGSAGASYALAAVAQLIYGPDSEKEVSRAPDYWPWGQDTWNPVDPRRNLVKAAALLIAEIDRIDRREASEKIAAPEAPTQNLQTESEKSTEQAIEVPVETPKEI